MQRKRRSQQSLRPKLRQSPEATLRIIGGQLRGHSFRYNGDPGLRPMKDRVREAVFNLIGPAVRGLAVVDLFAGTGAMSFEAISRGASSAVLVERRFPNVRAIEENAEALGIAGQVEVHAGDAFVIQVQPQVTNRPWLVFCCPPYDLFQERTADLLGLLVRFCEDSPVGSLIVVECDQRFDCGQLPSSSNWDIRSYPPATIGICETT